MSGDSQFLVQLAAKGPLRSFASFDLAARKFPQSGHARARRPLLNQHASATIDERSRDHEQESTAVGRAGLRDRI